MANYEGSSRGIEEVEQMSLNKPISQIEKADLIELKDNEEREGTLIDYKRDLVGSTDDDKREFRADITSFANASGGHIIFGIEEAEGVPVDICGVEIQDLDAELLRLDQLINTHIQPRVPRITPHSIKLENGKYCVILRIPKSLSQPHAVIHKSYMQFFSRGFAGKVQLDVPQIRESFLLSDAIGERIHQFRIERVGQIISENTPVIMDDSPKLICHLVPLSAYSTANSFAMSELGEALQKTRLRGFGSFARSNFDGILYSVSGDKGGNDKRYMLNGKYAQFYNNGSVEAVQSFASIYSWMSNDVPAKTINGYVLDTELKDDVSKLLKVMAQLEIEPPIFLMVSLIGVRGYHINCGQDDYDKVTIDRDTLLIPEVLIEDHTTTSEIIIKDILDRLWQSSGYLGSESYIDGIWDASFRRYR